MNVKIADRVRLAVTIAAGLIMLYALYVSKDHITHVAHLIGLVGYQAATLFVLIDLPAVIGKVLRLKYFAASTRKTGLRLMIWSGSLSLTCNVLSGWFGGGIGPAGYGVFVVTMFLVMENVVMKIKAASSVTRAKNAKSDETELPTPSAPPAVTHVTPVSRGRKCPDGCVCARHRSRNAMRDLEVSYQMPSAPVSGA